MKYFTIILLVLTFVSCTKENTEQSDFFVRMFGDYHSNVAYHIGELADGYIITGSTGTDNNGLDGYILKTNDSGYEVWSKQIGLKLDDELMSCAMTNGGFVVCGYSTDTISSGSQDKNIMVSMFTNSGDETWNKVFGGTGNQMALDIAVNNMGEIIVVGSTDSLRSIGWNNDEGINDAFVIKLDSSGDILWESQFGSSANDEAVSVDINKNGEVIVLINTAGLNSESGLGDKWMSILKLNDNGQLEQAKSLGSPGNDMGANIVCVDDGNVITGSIGSALYCAHTSEDLYADLIFEKSFSGLSNSAISTSGSAAFPLLNGGFVLSGTIETANNSDMYLIKIDNQGEVIFEKNYGGTGEERGYSVVESQNGGYVVAGESNFQNNSMIYMIKTTSSGDLK